jgi:magnesium-transporting ATPase (P-type)
MYYRKGIDETFTEMQTGRSGLTSEEAKRRLAEHGPNTLEKGPEINFFKVFIHQFADPLIYILIVAAMVTAILQDWVDTGVILAVIALYYAVGHWNAYFNAFMYLSDSKLFPLQIVLRSILLLNQVDSTTVSVEVLYEREALKNLLKYSLIVVASVPVLMLYPFIQKYFIRGVMIGSIKG